MARSGSPYSTPRDANRVPLLVAASTADGVTPVVLEADPTTHALVTSGSGGGGADVQYTDGAAAVTHPIGTIPVFNNAGTITAVSAANPLPVSATISTAGLATSTKQSDGSQKTQIVDGSGNVIASTGNALNVTGTFSATPTADATPATQNITAQDIASTTVTTNANGQSVRTGSPTTNSTALFTLSSWETALVQVTGTWTGTLLTEGSFDGGITFFQKALKQIGSPYLALSFTANFGGSFNVSGLTHLAIRSTAAWTGTATVLIRQSLNDNGFYLHNGVSIQDSVIQTNKLTVKSASTAPVAADTAAVVANSPNSAAMRLGNGITEVSVSGFGALNTSVDPWFPFNDTFSGVVIDTNNWVAAGTVPPTQNGAILVNPASTASATSSLVSNPTFTPASNSSFGIFVTLETTTIALGNYRCWGNSIAPSGVGTSVAPVQDGSVFEVDTSGVLRASIYAAGTRTFTQTLAVPTDGAAHLYVITYNAGITLWYKDTFTIPVASTALVPNNQVLPVRIVSLNSASVTGTPTLSGNQVGMADFAHQGQAIVDGTYGFRKATVSTTGALNTTGDIASGATDSGNPVKIGAVFRTTQPTVTDGQRVDLQANARGELKTAITQNGNSAAIATAGADASSNTVNTLAVTGYSKVWNGATWDRMSGDTTGINVKALVGALPTGANSIGKISDITTSVVPGTAATNLGKAEDAAHTTGDTGVFTLGVRNDGAATAFTNANGDYNPIGTDSQGRMYVVQKAPTATLTNVNSSATNVTLLVVNTARIGAQFYNDSTQILYMKFGTTATSTSFTVPLAAATYYELPGGYTGNIDGIWVSANGAVRITELT